MQGFWRKLKKPVFVLAPMADVTDAAFRRVIAARGKPDVMFTEFTSADGLAKAPEEGRKKLLLDLIYTDSERPIVAQFFTSHPEHMRRAAALAAELGFDGVDINMGCPDKGVEKQGAGAALIKNPSVARALIRAAQEGVHSTSSGRVPIPVSVKTRIGWNSPELETWLPEILKEEPAAVTIHARTRKEMSKVPARWEFVKRAVELRNEMGSKTLILGNGDAKDLEDGRRRIEETGADGVMLGRAIFGNPWLFAERVPLVRERIETLIEHIRLFDELLGHAKNFAIMKKHFKAYLTGFDRAGDLRSALMDTADAAEAVRILEDFLRDM